MVGMYGKWGTGKTSILNMALQEIEKLSSTLDDDRKPIVIKFEPWNFSNNENLITQFFYLLRERINKKENAALKNCIGEALEQYSEALEFASVIPQLGPLSSILKLSMVFAGKQIKKKYTDRSIDSAKESLVKILREQKKKIIVIIDDIDRLTNEQIRMIFQLVKQVACFPNTTYVLSMDKDVVCRALEEIQQCSGEVYLEKIVQIPFNIPELDKNIVHKLLLEKLNEILKSKPMIEFNEEHWMEVYQGCIVPYINTIRDVNRVINSFQFKYDMVYSEVNFADMIGITTLEVLKPELLKWIIENKEKLCGSTYDYIDLGRPDEDKRKKEYIESFKLKNIGDEISIIAVSSLFPKFDKDINPQYKPVSEKDLRGQLRISHIERFDLYFKLNLNEIKIHRGMITDSIYRLEEQELDNLIRKVNNEGNIITYLEELCGKLDEVPYERIEIILRVLYKNKPWMEGTKGGIFSASSANYYAEYCITPLLQRLTTTEERYHVYNQLIVQGDISVLSGICRDINRMELAYGRLAGVGYKEGRQLVTLDELVKIEKAFASRLQELAKADCIFEAKSLIFIKYLWEAFDKEECEKYFNEKLKENKYKLKFICRLATDWKGTDSEGWSFQKNNYEGYVDENEILDMIEKYDKNIMFMEFTEAEIIKLAFFVLNRGMSDMECAAENDAITLMKEWKNGMLHNPVKPEIQ